MDTSHKFKKPYSSFLEGVASEHPDAEGQPDLQKRADEILARRKKAREDARNPQVQRAKKAAAFFSKSAIRKEEVEVEVEESLKTENPCWKGYKPVGVKTKKGRKVPNCVPEEFELGEAHMTASDVKQEEKLKKKYDPSGMKASMIKQYGPEKGKQVYFATIRKQAMKEYFELDEALVQDDIEDEGAEAETQGRVSSAQDYVKRLAQQKKKQELARKADEVAAAVRGGIADDYNYELDEAKLPRAERQAKNVGKKGYDTKGKPTTKGGVHAFDVDETLFSHGVKGKPNVKVHVNDPSGKRVKSLTNQDFNTHKLNKGHSYDFSEFGSAGKFSQTASPNKKVISQLKRLQKRGKNVQLITARDKFDKPEEFRQHFVRHGIKLAPGNIHYAGGMKGSDIGQKKVAVAKGLAKMGKTSSIHMYDDAAKVHKAFEAEKGKNPKLKVKTHLAKPNKRGEVMTRSYQATKSEEFELWVNSLLDEGYDLSEFTVDELVEAYNELDEALVAAPAPEEDKIPHKKAPRPKLGVDYTKKYTKKDVKEEAVEVSPYEFWKSFIGEEEEVSDETIIEETEEVIERTPTSYDYWKAVITEQGDTTKL
jgi:hypothetical protein